MTTPARGESPKAARPGARRSIQRSHATKSKAPGSAQSMLRLQASAGNAAVARLLVQRDSTAYRAIQDTPLCLRSAAGGLVASRTPDADASNQTEVAEGSPGNRPNLDVGARGPGVKLLQGKLNEVGPSIPVTGIFDKVTRRAVVAFQKKRPGLHPATGGVGPGTWRFLDARPPATLASIHLSISEVADLARHAGIPTRALVVCVSIAMAESGLHPWAYNDANKDGSIDRGLWQINSMNNDSDEVFSPEINAFSMATLSGRGRNWTFWAVFTNGSYRAHVATVARTLGLPQP